MREGKVRREEPLRVACVNVNGMFEVRKRKTLDTFKKESVNVASIRKYT